MPSPPSSWAGEWWDLTFPPPTPDFCLLCPAQGIQELPKPLQIRLHSLGSCTACTVRICGEQHSLFGRTLLLLTRQITVSWIQPLASKGRRWTHWCGRCWQLCQKPKLWPKMPGTLYCIPWELAFNSLGEILRQLSDCFSFQALAMLLSAAQGYNSMFSPCSAQDLPCQAPSQTNTPPKLHTASSL